MKNAGVFADLYTLHF